MNDLKNKIRKEMVEKRDGLSEEAVQEKSRSIKEKLFSLKRFRDAGLVMFYSSFKNEVATGAMISDAISLKKKIALPVTLKKDSMIKPYMVNDPARDCIPGVFGISEPNRDICKEADAGEIDMIVVPGLAFDRKGYRIGFGAGFYDRFIHSIEPHVFCAGLAYEIQVTDSVPKEEYDERMDVVITEENIYEVR